jgi:methionine biosynthesis protein MetW
MTDRQSPDAAASGLLEAAPDPLRYDWEGVFGKEDVREVPAIVARWLPSGASVLDVGCGAGAVTVLVSQGKDTRVLGVEPDPARAEAARAQGLDIVTGFADEAFMAKHGPFDVILFTDVLEHLPAPGDMITLATKGLRPGGFIIASVPNVAHWTVRFRLLLGRFNYTEYGIMDATHLRWFTRKSFVALFEHHGLKVVGLTASAGTWLGEYNRLPFRLLPRRWRRALVQGLSQRLPGLFGCQHVVKAQFG